MLFVPEDLITCKRYSRAIKKIDHFFHPAAQVCGIYYVHRENIDDPTLDASMSQHMLEISKCYFFNRDIAKAFASERG